MHPAAFQEYQRIKSAFPNHWALSSMVEAQHFLVTNGMIKFALKIARALGSSSEKAAIPDSALPCASKMLLVIDLGHENQIWLVEADPDLPGASHLYSQGPRGFIHFAKILAGSSDIVVTDRAKETWPEDSLRTVPVYLGIVLSLINSPRKIVRRQETASRQVRRSMERVIERPVAGWVSVGWEINKALERQKGVISTQGSPRALHWCRAYHVWAPEQKQTPHAVWLRADDPAAQFGEGWYQRRSDSWRGHPDYGIRLHHYNPRMLGEKSHGGPMRGVGASSPERLALMDRAKVAALQAAGFV